MPLRKKPRPVGACSVCRSPTDRHEALNHRCERVVYGRRCAGTYHSDLSDVWDECEACGGTGRVGTQECSACGGFGWHLFG